ncbi:MAG: hypothetical protein ACK40V_03540, partial [Anaerolineales bacterium]
MEELNERLKSPIDAVFSKDSSFLVGLVASTIVESDAATFILILRLEDGLLLKEFDGPYIDSDTKARYVSVALSNNSQFIATGDNFGGVRIIDTTTWREVAFLEFDYIPLNMSFTSDDTGLIVALGDGTYRLLGLP